MRYVYIAGPYTRGDPVTNTGDAIRMADILVSVGYIPFIPHLSLLWHLLRPHALDFWYEYDLAWLDKCDCLLRLSGESPGADKEVEYAITKQIPVYYSVDELIEGELSG